MQRIYYNYAVKDLHEVWTMVGKYGKVEIILGPAVNTFNNIISISQLWCAEYNN